MSIRNALKNGTATLEFGAASSANTTFAADAAGTLQLDNSFDFSGIVSGLDGNDRLDFSDIQFSDQLQMNYIANAEGTGAAKCLVRPSVTSSRRRSALFMRFLTGFRNRSQVMSLIIIRSLFRKVERIDNSGAQ